MGLTHFGHLKYFEPTFDLCSDFGDKKPQTSFIERYYIDIVLILFVKNKDA